MSNLLDKFAVAERIGVQPKTAAALMMEMNPIPVTGKVRHRWAVTEENLERWIAKKMLVKAYDKHFSKGNRKQLERRK